MATTQYNQIFKEEVLRQLLNRGDRTIADVAVECNVTYQEVRNWQRSPKLMRRLQERVVILEDNLKKMETALPSYSKSPASNGGKS